MKVAFFQMASMRVETSSLHRKLHSPSGFSNSTFGATDPDASVSCTLELSNREGNLYH